MERQRDENGFRFEIKGSVVLETRLMSLLIVATLFCACAGCHKAEVVSASQQTEPRPAPLVDERLVKDDGTDRNLIIRGFDLKLEDRDRTCVLIFAKDADKAEIKLRVPTPCRFVGGDSKPLIYSYDKQRRIRNETEKDSLMTVLLVANSRPHPSRDVDPLHKNDCDRRAQAVIVRQSSVTVSEDEHRELACGTEFFDEKVFSILAHP